jgi:hypothetical protein
MFPLTRFFPRQFTAIFMTFTWLTNQDTQLEAPGRSNTYIGHFNYQERVEESSHGTQVHPGREATPFYVQSGLNKSYFVVIIYSVMVIRILKYRDDVQAHTHVGADLHRYHICSMCTADHSPKVKKELQENPKKKLKIYFFRSKESTESWFPIGLGTVCVDAMHLKVPLELVQDFDMVFW